MADEFALLRDTIQRVFPKTRLDPVGDADVASLRRHYPGVPEHYLEFLRHVGWGSLGDNFMLYGGLCEADEILDPRMTAGLADIVFFGDNFSGRIVGFDTRNGWRLVAVDSDYSLTPEPQQAKTIGDFIAQRLSECEAE